MALQTVLRFCARPGERGCVLCLGGAWHLSRPSQGLPAQGNVQADLGQIGEALATFREAQKLYTVSATQGDATPWEVKQESMVTLCNVAKLLQLHNQFAEAVKYYDEVLSTRGLHVPVCMQCVQALAVLNNQRKN